MDIIIYCGLHAVLRNDSSKPAPYGRDHEEFCSSDMKPSVSILAHTNRRNTHTLSLSYRHLLFLPERKEATEPMEDEGSILRKMRRLTDYYDVHKEIGRCVCDQRLIPHTHKSTCQSSGGVGLHLLNSDRQTSR